ncbi:MAG: hypothetical protein EA377_04545 [Phycisphaerales bacterium]|nr:MAG: hypothetical protein EA377_04545 [Phycisphaerales bacterium]
MMNQSDISRLRAYCDGELEAADRDQVERLLAERPEARTFVEADQRLRERVDVAIGRDVAPASLRADIQAMLVADAVQSETVQSETTASSVATATEPAADTPAESWLDALIARFLRPKQVSFAAVAVVILAVATVVGIGMFGTPIDEIRPADRPVSGTVASDVAQWVVEEHNRCSSDQSVLEKKLSVHRMDQAVVRLGEFFNIDQAYIFDLSDVGYEFVGMGFCEAHEQNPAAHLVYRAEACETNPSRHVSIFVVPAENIVLSEGCSKLQLGQWNHVYTGRKCRKEVLLANESDLAYFLICCSRDDTQQVASLIGSTLARR